MSIILKNFGFLYFNGEIEIDSSDGPYSDYTFDSVQFKKLDPVVNKRYYFRALINDDYNYGFTKITKRFLVPKNYTINVELVKDDFNPHASQFVQIYKGCAMPNITIEQNYTKNNPFRSVRSKPIALSSINHVECDIAYTSELIWSATLLNSTDFQPIRKFALASIANTNLPTLFVPENSLNYGLYQFKLEFIARYAIKNISAEAVTHYEILPTGI